MRRRSRSVLRPRQIVLLLLMGVLSGSAAVSAEPADELFEKQVAPAFAAKCVACHRPDNLKGNLDLTTREGMLSGGDSGDALIPGNVEESPLYTRTIPHEGNKPEMPEKGEPLNKKETLALREWIESGANWPEKFVIKEAAKADRSFWSLQPLAESVPPEVPQGPEAWQKHPIDRFVFAKLSEEGLQPNGPASPEEFIRRATYDLIGLPPTPEEVAEFEQACEVARVSPEDLLPDQPVAALIDRLLASPQYGEQWGRHWLDVIRFGESRGYERNEIITNLWPFRDYVIRSFNEDKPFDRLTLEHLAGDVIGRDQPDIEIGSAFLVAGPYDDVGNQDPMAAAQIRADQMDEMIRATGEAFLGVTIGCTRCHDHKFDPLYSNDYYSLYATFAGTVHGPREVSTQAARQERTSRLEPLQAEQAKLAQQREALEKELVAQVAQIEAEVSKEWTRPKASRYGTEETFTPVTAKFVRLLVDGTDSSDRNRMAYQLDEFEIWTAEESPRNVALASAGGKASGASREAKDFQGAYGAYLTIDGRYEQRWQAGGPELTIELSEPIEINKVVFSSDRPRALSEEHGLTTFVGDYRIEVSHDGQEWQQVASSADRLPICDQRKASRLLSRVTTPEVIAQREDLQKRSAEIANQIGAIPGLPVWWVGNHRDAPGPFKTFIGGSPGKPGSDVQIASLQILSDLPSTYQLDNQQSEGERRVSLAKWLTSADQPLTPRVLANRLWHYHFGTGIVDTPSDFGYMGSRPTHPELLDWLARELIANGWHLKPLHRLIMTSQVYRQSGSWREDAARVDAGARLLWRFPPKRLTGEEIRDTILSIAGKLDLTMGGPGYKLYEYQQDNVATYVPLDRIGPETYRRGIYHHNARAARVDVLTDFDCPDPAFADPRRASTTTPLQALTLMNHSFAFDMSQFLSERLQREAADPSGQIERAYQLAYNRPPSEEERQEAEKLVQQHGLLIFCRALLNSNELIYLE